MEIVVYPKPLEDASMSLELSSQAVYNNSVKSKQPAYTNLRTAPESTARLDISFLCVL